MRGRPPLRQLWIPLALGLIAALGLAPFDIWIATPLAVAILIRHVARSGGVFWPLLAAGFGWFALSMSWIVEPFLVEPDI
jgi:apolipoprotein N-acyltransferase